MLFLLFYNYIMSVGMSMSMSMQVPSEARVVRSPGAGDVVSCLTWMLGMKLGPVEE